MDKQIMKLWYMHANEYCAMIKNKTLSLKNMWRHGETLSVYF